MTLYSDHLDPLDTELMLLAVGELDDRHAERLQARLADDPTLRARFEAFAGDMTWLEDRLPTVCDDDRPVRLEPTLRAVRENLLTQPAASQKAVRGRRLLSGMPTWMITSTAAAAAVIAAILVWGLRDGPDQIGPTLAGTYGGPSTDTEFVLRNNADYPMQWRAEWAFGLDDSFDDAVAMSNVDDAATELVELNETDFMSQWSEMYQ